VVGDDDDDTGPPPGWTIQTVDSDGYVGAWSSLALDSNDKVHISYHDYGEATDTGFTKEDLKYATNSSGSWQTFVIDSAGDVGSYTSIALDSNDKVHISYFADLIGDLKYATNAEAE